MRSTDRHTRKRPVGRAVASLLLVVFAALLVSAPGANAVQDADSPRSDKPYASLEDAVAAEAIEPKVVSDLERRGQVDGLVNLDAAALIDDAEAAASEGPDRSREILAQLLPALAAQKEEALASLEQKLEVVREFEALPTMVVRFESPGALLELVNRPQVGGVAANRAMKASLAQSLSQVRQTAALGATGANTAVAILDSGLDFTRAAFGSCTSPGTPAGCRVAFAQDFGFPDNMLDDPDPAIGLHGTNVAGIAAGVAPGARILALDVFEGASAWHDDVLAAVNFVTQTQPGFGTRAMNLSLGVEEHWTSPCSNPWTNPYLLAFRAARAVGIAPVVAAGNAAVVNGSFIDGVGYPACTPGAVSVGAVYDDNVGTRITDANRNGVVDTTDCVDVTTGADRITCYSQSGPILSILAPGDLIKAADVTMIGTSQAAPHVTGAVAVLAGARPQASVDTLELAITRSGPSITDPRNGVAKRRLDVRDALAIVNCFSPGLFPIIGTPGPDQLTGTIFPDVIIGLGGNDTISGGAGNDVLCGGEGFDTIRGGPGPDLLQGDEQGDFLDGGDHVDVMSGGDGNDWVEAGPLSSNGDELVGGNGTDVADYGSRPAAPLTITLDNVADDGAAGEGDNVRSDFETVYGGADSDRLVGSSGANDLFGGFGNDVLDGGFGTDYLDGGPGIDTTTYAARATWLEISLDGKPNDGAPGERDDVRTENVIGGSGADTIVGDADANRLDGGPGDDRLRDGEASCLGFCVANSADVLIGGAGRDRTDYSARVDSVDISLDGVANDGAWGEGDNVLTEDIAGGSAEDWLSGDTASNWISGGPGDDWLTGGAGPDSLLCGLGTDFAVDLEAQDTQSDCEYVGLPQSDRPPPPLP
jgi:Ca2+-binding RTX toxin-like protein